MTRPSFQVYLYSDYQLWTGAQADYAAGFHWSDEEPFDFVNWQVGEPNNYLGEATCFLQVNALL